MVAVMSNTPDEYSEEEAAKRRDEVLKKMLNTPPKPHKERKAPNDKEKG